MDDKVVGGGGEKGLGLLWLCSWYELMLEKFSCVLMRVQRQAKKMNYKIGYNGTEYILMMSRDVLSNFESQNLL